MICKLNTNQKELLTLLYRDGYTLSEVADRIYHTSVAAVSLRLSRILTTEMKVYNQRGELTVINKTDALIKWERPEGEAVPATCIQ